MKGLNVRSSKLFLFISIAAACLAALTLLAYLHNINSRVAESGKLVHLVVAARDLQAGEVLDASSLTCVDFPDRYLLPGSFTDPLAATGNSLGHNLQAGEPLLESALVSPYGSGLVLSSLDQNFRAYPLPSTSVCFPPGELAAGNRVDVLAVSNDVARPLLENVEILGISGRHAYAQSPEESMATSSPGECIMLQVTCEEACRLAAAQEAGKVEILLRPSQRP